MDSNNIPFYFLYFVSYPPMDFNYGLFGASHQGQTTWGQFPQRGQDQNQDKFFLESEGKNESLDVKQKLVEEEGSKQEIRNNSERSQVNELSFRQRQQTVNRNLSSNTLKVYFKQLRDPKTQTSLNINKIIQSNKISMTHQKFIKKASALFPLNSTYISLDQLKKKLDNNLDQEDQSNFNKIFRASLKRFFSYEIFAVNIKSARTTRKIRNQQIKQGKIILRQLSL